MVQLQNNSPNITSGKILELADRCVKCGLCLPQCPTYQLSANENESPRGRIALIQGWLGGQLEANKTLTDHLDQCLLCRRCERICPSVVPYGEIMDQAKYLLSESTQAGFSLHRAVRRSSLHLLINKTFSRSLFSLLRLLQLSGLIHLARKAGLFKFLGLQREIRFLPRLEKPLKTKTFYPVKNQKSQGNVALFTGCISNSLDSASVSASIRLLNRFGYGVFVPEQQVCCGAIHLHQGEYSQAQKYANSNIETFNQLENIVAIISLVNGCTSQLREYPRLDTTQSFTLPVKDIIEFIAELEWPKDFEIEPLEKTVALQIPCSLQNSLRAEEKLKALLQKIPGINLPPESVYNRCCGAAGSYFLRFPGISDNLQQNAIQALTQNKPELIISSNIGCALQLKAGLAMKNSGIKIIHPVLLLEQQLKNL